jgi:flagellar biosynthetic protein FliP
MKTSLKQFCKKISKNKNRIIAFSFFFLISFFLFTHTLVNAQPVDSIIGEFLTEQSNYADLINLVIVLTLLAFLPAIILTVTVFPRILIVLSFTRNGIGTQQTPPNQVLIGIALILTFFIMSPVIDQIVEEAYNPLMAGEIESEQAFDNAIEPLREFMFSHARSEPDSVNFFLQLSGVEEYPETLEDMPTPVLMMSFITSELKKAFTMGFIIFIPFIVVDMIVASVLMSMGMMMIPPTTISLPFKILLFVLVDGWTLVFRTLVSSVM